MTGDFEKAKSVQLDDRFPMIDIKYDNFPYYRGNFEYYFYFHHVLFRIFGNKSSVVRICHQRKTNVFIETYFKRLFWNTYKLNKNKINLFQIFNNNSGCDIKAIITLLLYYTVELKELNSWINDPILISKYFLLSTFLTSLFIPSSLISLNTVLVHQNYFRCETRATNVVSSFGKSTFTLWFTTGTTTKWKGSGMVALTCF